MAKIKKPQEEVVAEKMMSLAAREIMGLWCGGALSEANSSGVLRRLQKKHPEEGDLRGALHSEVKKELELACVVRSRGENVDLFKSGRLDFAGLSGRTFQSLQHHIPKKFEKTANELVCTYLYWLSRLERRVFLETEFYRVGISEPGNLNRAVAANVRRMDDVCLDILERDKKARIVSVGEGMAEIFTELAPFGIFCSLELVEETGRGYSEGGSSLGRYTSIFRQR